MPTLLYERRGSSFASLVRPEQLIKASSPVNLDVPKRRIVMRLMMNKAINSHEIILADREGASVFQEIVQAGCACWRRHDSQPLRWYKKKRKTQPVWRLQSNGLYQPVLDNMRDGEIVLPLTPPLYLHPEEGYCGELTSNLPYRLLRQWLEAAPMSSVQSVDFADRLKQMYKGVQLPDPEDLEIHYEDDVEPVVRLVIQQRQYYISGFSIGDQIKITVPAAQLVFLYDERTVAPNDADDYAQSVRGGKLVRILRRRDDEARALDLLGSYGLTPVSEVFPQYRTGAEGVWWTIDERAGYDWRVFLTQGLPHLRELGWQVDFPGDFCLAPIFDQAWYTDVTPTEGAWFYFEAGFNLGERKVNILPYIKTYLMSHAGWSLAEMEADLKSRSFRIDVDAQTTALVDGARVYSVLAHVFALFDLESDRSTLRLNTWRIAELAELEDLSSTPWGIPDQVRALRDKLKAGNELVLEPASEPDGFQGTLRSYQALGLAWLQFLRTYQLHGILADDMGLGKTIQALSHLLTEKKAGRLDKPCLIVAPTSLMQNWRDEARRFAPELNVLVLHGSERKELRAQAPGCDLLLTTYPLVWRDRDYFTKQSYSFIILDEAQAIKNAKSQTAQTVRYLKADHRLCLTGTPMENHLGELWALFRFLMPGLLDDEKTFNKRYRNAIEKNGNDDMRALLNRRVSPFILRRTKEEVEQDLPSKTEIVLDLELTERQCDLYESVRLAMQQKVRQALVELGLNRSHIVVLEALLKLRQICCDPRLVKGVKSTPQDSCKIEALREIMPEMIEEGRRILLFSQFTSMLALVRELLAELNLRYELLTGSTRDRATPIRRFQQRETPIFLISLKAGGVGLNLTAADTVIHFDPWWNPAVENQATDRAYRIGQSKPVFVYKLIAQGTVEERILELQQRKSALLNGIMQQQQGESITFEEKDLELLLAPVGE